MKTWTGSGYHLLDSLQDLGDGFRALSMALPSELQGEHRGRHALQEALNVVEPPAAALVCVARLLILGVNALRMATKLTGRPCDGRMPPCAPPGTTAMLSWLTGILRLPSRLSPEAMLCPAGILYAP